MLSDQFAQVFWQEHWQVRDTLLDLVRAFQNRDRIPSRLTQAPVYTGSRFRYEVESLYPALEEIFGREYIEKLPCDHDRVIGTAKKLIELAGKGPLTDDDVAATTRYIRGMLPHVSDYDGLSLMVERLPSEKVAAVLGTRERSLKAGLNLMQWANEVRRRSAVAPSSQGREK